MYKLFLTIRYLTRKKIVIFPILVVWLCLMMMIIVTSIMGGFVERVRETNRELLGDVVISSDTAVGWSGYEELRTALAKQFPEVAVTTPVVEAYGLANFPRYKKTKPVMLVGINPEERAKVSRFREALFEQYIGPHQAVEDIAKYLPADKEQLVAGAVKNQAETQDTAGKAMEVLQKIEVQAGAGGASVVAATSPNWWWLCGLIVVAALVYLAVRKRPGRTGWSFVGGGLVAIVGLGVVIMGVVWPMIFNRDYALAEDRLSTAQLNESRAFRTAQYMAALPDGAKKYATKEDLLAAISPKAVSFEVPAEAKMVNPDAAPQGCIAGVQIGMYRKDKRGNFERPEIRNYLTTTITVFPVSEKSGAVATSGVATNSEQFTIVDDSYTGVYDVDSLSMYAPFEKVQVMAGMRVQPELLKLDPTADFPPRCNEVLIKLATNMSPSELKLMRSRIDAFVQKWQDGHPGMDSFPLVVETWDERQAKYLNAVENEKVMQTFILGLMSLVVLVVIFLIFYMIVRDKTRDIGIIKAIGGSEEGVAGIFLTYGLFIGLVGGILGVISGVAFVTHTNQIHEWIYQTTGIVIWDRSVYLFDEIPHTVNPSEVAIYFGAALLAGVIGALIPALVAGAENPVKAVRYE